MKKIIISLSVIGAIAAAVAGITSAVFNDTETSTGNIFTAGSMDLKVDHLFASYNGSLCLGECKEIGDNLIVNGGFETPVLPFGSWAVYTNADVALTSWTVESGAGLEIQNHAAGDPHIGNQLAELDSNNSSVVSQSFATVAGGKYRLKFWYSPRPNRPAGDNTIGMDVKVVSDSTVIINDTIGAESAGGSNTVWQEKVYEFVAVDTNTKIVFSDLGTNNSFGGYLDDVSVVALECGHAIAGGNCTLWNLKDLDEEDYFWNYGDVKPGDFGVNVISLHAFNNDAFACLATHSIWDQENGIVEPEAAAGDTSEDVGELSGFIKIFAWEDDGDGLYEGGIAEPILVGPNANLATIIGKINLTASNTKNIGLAWCAGTQSLDDTNIVCDGSSMDNTAQSDIMTAAITAYAEQQRNNGQFECSEVNFPPVVY